MLFVESFYHLINLRPWQAKVLSFDEVAVLVDVLGCQKLVRLRNNAILLSEELIPVVSASDCTDCQRLSDVEGCAVVRIRNVDKLASFHVAVRSFFPLLVVKRFREFRG